MMLSLLISLAVITAVFGAIGSLAPRESETKLETFTPNGHPEDCLDILRRDPAADSGIYKVFIGKDDRHTYFIDVFCDMKTDGGGWLVFQRRKNGKEYFYRTWGEYAQGFGSLAGEFWLGNDNLHHLTTRRNYQLRVDLEDFDNQTKYAKYTTFRVGSACEKYQLKVFGYHGNAGDSMSFQDRMKFSTKDQDNDRTIDDCAVKFKGAWWYNDCHLANLNGAYLKGEHASFADGINWETWRGYHYSLKFTEMKIRPGLAPC